jgi:hypothetical protein
MSRRYTTTLSLSIGGDTPTWEGEAEVSYTVAWGRGPTPPSYSHGGLPADPDEVNDIRVTHIDGRPVAAIEYGKLEAETLETHIECSDALLCQLLTDAAEQHAAEYEAAMERRWEAQRDDRLTGLDD